MAGVSSDDEVRSGASSPSVFASAVEFDWEAALAAPIPPCMKLLEKSVAQNKVDLTPLLPLSPTLPSSSSHRPPPLCSDHRRL